MKLNNAHCIFDERYVYNPELSTFCFQAQALQKIEALEMTVKNMLIVSWLLLMVFPNNTDGILGYYYLCLLEHAQTNKGIKRRSARN